MGWKWLKNVGIFRECLETFSKLLEITKKYIILKKPEKLQENFKKSRISTHMETKKLHRKFEPCFGQKYPKKGS
jgi:hypothetical protein